MGLRGRAWLLVLLAVAGCEDSSTVPTPGTTTFPATENWTHDILHTELEVSVESLSGTARIELAPSAGTSASFETQGLMVDAVEDASGEPLLYEVVGGRLDVGHPPSDEPTEVVVRYRFGTQQGFEGLMESGSTLVWPYFCGNLFPCKSAPDDGMSFGLSVKDLPPGQTAVFPASVAFPSPSYMVAWASGEYGRLDLGTTAAGTTLSAWYLPDGEMNATIGTANLVEAFDYFEQRLGNYAFGDEAGAVAVQWGGVLGGMEHHPFWHVSLLGMGDQPTQFHEAAHGWFGNGVRIACWEDFVLSEGTVSYLTARATEEVLGQDAADALWTAYSARLQSALFSTDNHVAWPEGCGVIDIIGDGLFSNVPYMKGALFYRALERRVGVEALMDVLAEIYQEHVGGAAHMQDVLDLVQLRTGYDPTACANAWLRQAEVPSVDICP